MNSSQPDFRFEKLDVWQQATEFTKMIYLTTRTFPAEERFGLTSQVRRSAISIAANIAEGSGRGSDKDFARFLEMAYGSLMETVSHIIIGHQLTLIGDQQLTDLKAAASKVARMLSGLRRSLNRE